MYLKHKCYKELKKIKIIYFLAGLLTCPWAFAVMHVCGIFMWYAD